MDKVVWDRLVELELYDKLFIVDEFVIGYKVFYFG